jgi:hypothetical protein
MKKFLTLILIVGLVLLPTITFAGDNDASEFNLHNANKVRNVTAIGDSEGDTVDVSDNGEAKVKLLPTLTTTRQTDGSLAGTASTSGCTVFDFEIVNLSGSTVTVEIYDDSSATGTPRYDPTIPNNGQWQKSFGDRGSAFSKDPYIDLDAGVKATCSYRVD